VVAGDEDDAPSGHRFPQLGEEWLGQLEHPSQREVAQLEHVAEQDEAVGRGDPLEQRGADRRVADQVLAGTAAQVQVGDDRGAHRPNLVLASESHPGCLASLARLLPDD